RRGDTHCELDARAAVTIVERVHGYGCLTGVVRLQDEHARLVDGGADHILIARTRQHPELVTVRVARVDTKLARLASGHLLVLDRGDGRVLVRRDNRHGELCARSAATTVVYDHSHVGFARVDRA